MIKISKIVTRQFVISYFITVMALFETNVTIGEFFISHCVVTFGLTIFLLTTRKLIKILLKLTNFLFSLTEKTVRLIIK